MLGKSYVHAKLKAKIRDCLGQKQGFKKGRKFGRLLKHFTFKIWFIEVHQIKTYCFVLFFWCLFSLLLESQWCIHLWEYLSLFKNVIFYESDSTYRITHIVSFLHMIGKNLNWFMYNRSANRLSLFCSFSVDSFILNLDHKLFNALFWLG